MICKASLLRETIPMHASVMKFQLCQGSYDISTNSSRKQTFGMIYQINIRISACLDLFAQPLVHPPSGKIRGWSTQEQGFSPLNTHSNGMIARISVLTRATRRIVPNCRHGHRQHFPSPINLCRIPAFSHGSTSSSTHARVKRMPYIPNIDRQRTPSTIERPVRRSV